MKVIGKAVPEGGYWVGGRRWEHDRLTAADLTDAEYAASKDDPHLVLVAVPDGSLCASCGAKLGETTKPGKGQAK
jgi:hypothetical protein